jgi:hypothetical protein
VAGAGVQPVAAMPRRTASQRGSQPSTKYCMHATPAAARRQSQRQAERDAAYRLQELTMPSATKASVGRASVAAIDATRRCRRSRALALQDRRAAATVPISSITAVA